MRGPDVGCTDYRAHRTVGFGLKFFVLGLGLMVWDLASRIEAVASLTAGSVSLYFSHLHMGRQSGHISAMS